MNRTELKTLLESREATIKFTKLNNTVRTMRATLEPSKLPAPVVSGRVSNQETLTVYDLDKQDWRSFRVSSVISVQ